jgi:crotonobetainyl-CoA:carnitine CoA-transferase CaiB-like acyl-CoA transferase
MGGALVGIRPIDFGQYLPGPLLAVMLADGVGLFTGGAIVLHVEDRPPVGI